jgi:proteic killer suppression protein
VIRSFRHKGLKELWEKGRSAAVAESLRARCVRRLDAIEQAGALRELSLPGFNLHELRGKPTRYAIAVNGPWRITFAWEEGDALQLDLEQYH